MRASISLFVLSLSLFPLFLFSWWPAQFVWGEEEWTSFTVQRTELVHHHWTEQAYIHAHILLLFFFSINTELFATSSSTVNFLLLCFSHSREDNTPISMYYHHLFSFIVLFLILPSFIELNQIQTDVLILPNHAQPGYILLEEIQPSRTREFHQCLQNNISLNLAIDEKYGDLILDQSIENLPLNQQNLLCTINRNQVWRALCPFRWCVIKSNSLMSHQHCLHAKLNESRSSFFFQWKEQVRA